MLRKSRGWWGESYLEGIMSCWKSVICGVEDKWSEHGSPLSAWQHIMIWTRASLTPLKCWNHGIGHGGRNHKGNMIWKRASWTPSKRWNEGIEYCGRNHKVNMIWSRASLTPLKCWNEGVEYGGRNHKVNMIWTRALLTPLKCWNEGIERCGRNHKVNMIKTQSHSRGERKSAKVNGMRQLIWFIEQML